MLPPPSEREALRATKRTVLLAARNDLGALRAIERISGVVFPNPEEI
jgi:hypothetical protein